MGRENSFYPFDAPVEDPEWKPEIRAETYGCRVCRACGCGVDGPGGKCGGCKKVDYCHRLCQVADWKHRHKVECKKEDFDPLKTDDDKGKPQQFYIPTKLKAFWKGSLLTTFPIPAFFSTNLSRMTDYTECN